MQNFNEDIKNYIDLEIEILKKIDVDIINDVINAIVEAYKNDNKIYIFGNGGSAATASHFANDFNKGVSEFVERKFNFVCLNDNTATITAIANDCGYENIYSCQLQGRLKKEDLVIAISGSGNSKNIVRAAEYTNSVGSKLVGLTGYSGGELADLSDISLNVPIEDMQITEDIHMIFDHLIMSILCNNIKKLC